MRNTTIIITREEIECCDLKIAKLLDPKRFSKTELASLCGAVRFRFENATGPDDVFIQPASRQYVQSLHKVWPWAGYFLRCAPLRGNSRKEQIVDVGVLVAWAFCHTDEISLMRWQTPDVVGMRYNRDQFLAAASDLAVRAEELCDAVGMPPTAIRRRSGAILSSIQSFFDLGEAQKPTNTDCL